MLKGSLLVLLLSFIFIIRPNLRAQDFYAGPVVGVSFCQVDGDTYEGFNKPGMIIGGFVGRQISENWKAQLEISFIQKGSRKKPDIERNDYADYLIHLNYIQFPLTVQLSFGRFSIDGGVSIASLLSYREEVDGVAIPEDDQVAFKPIEISSIIGVSFDITDRLKLNGRFNYSITRVREPYNGEIEVYNPHWEKHKPGQYNDVVTFSLFYDLFYRR